MLCGPASPTAIGFIGPIGYQEMVVLAVVGVLIFGRRLPEVGRQVGKTIQGLRGSLQDFKAQIDADDDLREAKSTIHDIRRSIEQPMSLADLPDYRPEPERTFDALTHEEFAAPGPEAVAVAAPEPSVFEQEAARLRREQSAGANVGETTAAATDGTDAHVDTRAAGDPAADRAVGEFD